MSREPIDVAYDDNMRGVLFPNKKTSEKSPDYTGKLNIDGKEWRLAAWRKESKAGNVFLSLKVSEFPTGKEEPRSSFKPKGYSREAAQSAPVEGFDDSIPF
jgi:hypothetical protein